MNSLKVGQVVYAKCGRDKGFHFLVISVEGDYVYLVDGKRRSLANPKKKKCKHVQCTHFFADDIKKTLDKGGQVLDAHIRNKLKEYKNEYEGNKEVQSLVKK